MQIRGWTNEDISEIAQMERRCFQDPWTEEMLRDCLRYPYYHCFLAEEGGQVCGYCCLICLFEDAEVANIAVDELHRGKGIAKALLFAMENTARGLGGKQSLLEVRVGNAPAISLYQSFGYEKYGARKGYYGDGEDALLMRKNL